MNLKEMNPVISPTKMNHTMKTRFGFSIDYDNLTLNKAKKLSEALKESLTRIRKSSVIHTAERDPKYMEMLMVNEALDKFIAQRLQESKVGESEAILAAKDMVDSIQDMLEKLSKMQIEQMPALVDTIRDQIGMQQAEQFKNNIGALLTSMVEQMTQAREQADMASRQLAGDGSADMMSMAGGAPVPPPAGAPAAAPLPAADAALPPPAPGGAAADAAAGGPEALGRAAR